MTGLGLILLAAFMGWLLQPDRLTEAQGDRRIVEALLHAERLRVIAWAVVCVAMVAGLVTWAVLR